MKFSEYLKLIYERTKDSYGISMPKFDETVQDIQIDFSSTAINADNENLNVDDVSIFPSVPKNDLGEINYDNVLAVPEGNLQTPEYTQNTVELTPLEWVLKTLFGFKEVNEAADADADSNISKDEAIEFINELMKKDGNLEELSLEDFTTLIEEYGINLEEYVQASDDVPLAVCDYLSEDMESEDTDDVETQSVGETVSMQKNNLTASFHSAKSPTYKSGRVVKAPKLSKPEKTIDNMTLEELNAEKEKRVEKLNEKLTDLKNVQTGNTEGIKAAKNAEIKAGIAYETAVEKDPALKKYKDAIIENKQQIDDNNEKINLCKTDILDKELKISNQEHVYSSAVSNLEALNTSLSTLNSKHDAIEDKSKQAELEEKVKNVKSKVAKQKQVVAKEKQNLDKGKKELEKLNNSLNTLETQARKLEETKSKYEKIIDERASKVTKDAKDKYNAAIKKVKDITAEEMKVAKEAYDKATELVNKVNEKIKVVEANRIKSQNSFNDSRAMYNEMNLESQGLNFEVFEMAVEGYLNLPEDKKSTGMIGIFDTTQSADKERYYLIDLNTKTVVGRSVMKTGSGAYMGDVQKANKQGSHSTLSGFEQIASEYYSGKMGKRAMNLIGLEPGINDQAYNKRTVVHYASGNHTLGCKGFGPVRKSNGAVDVEATNAKMHKLFPEGAIIYTHPSDPNYKKLSNLYDAA